MRVPAGARGTRWSDLAVTTNLSSRSYSIKKCWSNFSSLKKNILPKHIPKHVPSKHVLRHVLKHVLKHVLRYVLKLVPEHLHQNRQPLVIVAY